MAILTETGSTTNPNNVNIRVECAIPTKSGDTILCVLSALAMGSMLPVKLTILDQHKIPLTYHSTFVALTETLKELGVWVEHIRARDIHNVTEARQTLFRVYQRTQHSWVWMLDDDCMPHHHCLETMWHEVCRQPNDTTLGAVVGTAAAPADFRHNGRDDMGLKPWRDNCSGSMDAWDMQGAWDIGKHHPMTLTRFQMGNCLVRKEALDQVGGFIEAERHGVHYGEDMLVSSLMACHGWTFHLMDARSVHLWKRSGDWETVMAAGNTAHIGTIVREYDRNLRADLAQAEVVPLNPDSSKVLLDPED